MEQDTIYELRSERKVLESEIADKIREFESEWDCSIRSIKTTRDKETKEVKNITLTCDIGREGEDYDPDQQKL